MRHFTVYKLDSHEHLVTHYTCEVVEQLPDGVRLEAHWERARMDLGYARFEPGDRFIEWFYTDRYYSIFEIYDGITRALKGWYCNIAAPAVITADAITYRDLLLDLWVAADGAMRVLDEDEFEADTALDEVLRGAARRALDEVRALVLARQAPFDRIAT